MSKASPTNPSRRPPPPQLQLLNRLGLHRPAPMLSQYAMIFMSVVLCFYALLLYAPVPPHTDDTPVFQVYRQEDGTFFGSDRLRRAPILYGWLHNVQGMLWCVTIPMQHVASVRRRYPALHRWSGRAAIFSSMSLSITGMLFSPRRLAYTAPLLHVHKLQLGAGARPVTVLAWPTFELALWLIGPTLLLSAYMTLSLARQKRFAEHARWATACTLLGYTVPLQRVAMLFVPVLAAALPHVSPAQRAFLRVPDDVIGKAHAEKAVFAFTTWTAAAVMGGFVVRGMSANKVQP